ncbi:DoxX family protein [Acuticoccus sediminis]|uniref:DoxX family protein n=1 Tax=Acuticoccus sediminis TaxID=2184697 RepID=A0A8B2NJJ4_9HYPH|nr:DoxX family protein [Acuticoccus sediminis]RAH99555.1 DoxX family protein [Acuticoccus sediminis]
MTTHLWRAMLVWLLTAFFAFGGLTNIFATSAIQAEYSHWGYPDGFHYVTGTLELATAALVVFPRTRLAGTALGILVMAAAVTTLVIHQEHTHALMPLATMAFLVLNGYAVLRARRVVSQ